MFRHPPFAVVGEFSMQRFTIPQVVRDVSPLLQRTHAAAEIRLHMPLLGRYFIPSLGMGYAVSSLAIQDGASETLSRRIDAGGVWSLEAQTRILDGYAIGIGVQSAPMRERTWMSAKLFVDIDIAR